MSVVKRFADGLVNVVANLGTDRDKASHTRYEGCSLSHADLLTMYRESWLARAIVDYPAEDSTRKWRIWRAEGPQITKIEALEKRLRLQRRLYEGLVAARLFGGACIYINTRTDGSTAAENPISYDEQLVSLVVLTPGVVDPGPIDRDIDSEHYGLPEYYTMRTAQGREVRIHPSRMVVLNGAHVPDSPVSALRWGDSVLQSAMDAVNNIDSTMANIASLVFEAKVDVFKFAGFSQLLQDNEDERVIRRLRLQAAMKGINGAVVTDIEDDYQQKSASFSGLPEVVTKFMDAVSGAARIPVTRLYGRAAAGLSGSGDGDERVYFDRVNYLQGTEIGPAMYHLDQMITQQALEASWSPDIYYEWAPLRQLTEADRADIFLKTASAARTLAGNDSGPVVPMDALSESVVNELTEQGVLPGLDQLVQEYGSLREQELIEPPEDLGFSFSGPPAPQEPEPGDEQ